jgi:hypothetical protein
MNLFVTDPDPYKCALPLDDKRVGKLCLEAVEMLTLTLAQHAPELVADLGLQSRCVREYQLRHPVTRWVGRTRTNWDWTHRHGLALAEEFRHRFRSVHSCEAELYLLAQAQKFLPEGDLTPWQNSARNLERGADCTHLPVPFAYRMYLHERWKTDLRPPKWTRRFPPKFLFTQPQLEQPA